jgi:hypothetical protein
MGEYVALCFARCPSDSLRHQTRKRATTWRVNAGESPASGRSPRFPAGWKAAHDAASTALRLARHAPPSLVRKRMSSIFPNKIHSQALDPGNQQRWPWIRDVREGPSPTSCRNGPARHDHLARRPFKGLPELKERSVLELYDESNVHEIGKERWLWGGEERTPVRSALWEGSLPGHLRAEPLAHSRRDAPPIPRYGKTLAFASPTASSSSAQKSRRDRPIAQASVRIPETRRWRPRLPLERRH